MLYNVTIENNETEVGEAKSSQNINSQYFDQYESTENILGYNYSGGHKA